MARKSVIIRLTPEEADLVYRNTDGWLDAGACEGGLEPAERSALMNLSDQISRQIHRRRRAPAQSPSTSDGEG